MDSDLPAALVSWQPQLRSLLLVEQGFADAALAEQRNLVAALFRLEQSRTPADIERVLSNLIEWHAAPGQADLRRAFVVWLKRVLLPARVPGADIPNIIELYEVRDMLAERVKAWTEEWKDEGRKRRRARHLPDPADDPGRDRRRLQFDAHPCSNPAHRDLRRR